jgi:tripartite-type tricarboxylate transporter receptor subunit TctC
MLTNTKQSFLDEIRQIAQKNLIKKLQQQGINHMELDNEEFEALLEAEIDILKSDTKKVGLGVGIGIAISLLTGI